MEGLGFHQLFEFGIVVDFLVFLRVISGIDQLGRFAVFMFFFVKHLKRLFRKVFISRVSNYIYFAPSLNFWLRGILVFVLQKLPRWYQNLCEIRAVHCTRCTSAEPCPCQLTHIGTAYSRWKQLLILWNNFGNFELLCPILMFWLESLPVWRLSILKKNLER